MILSIQPLDFHWQTLDPFLFCAFHHDRFPAGNEALGPAASLAGRRIGMDFEQRDGWRMYHGQKVPGFPSHPHRGFETVTIVQQGLVDHADSLGAAGRYGQGDVQWMTAGRGVQHSEMFPLLNRERDNPLLLFQIWLNLPAKNKLVDPHFTMFWSEQVPVLHERDGQGRSVRVTIVAGSHKDLQALAPPPGSWAADPANGVRIWLVEMEPGADWRLPQAGARVNRMLFYYQGENIELNGQKVPALHGLRLDAGAAQVTNGKLASHLLLLEGAPIGEPVAQHGPFVMNTREELIAAFEDYRKDEFGGWPWPDMDQVHGRRPRFARFADGTEEEPAPRG